MKFREIKKFITSPHYRVNVGWDNLEANLQRYAEKRGSTGDIETMISPDFQRAHVWTQEQQIAYVEFKLRGGEGSDVLLFNCPSWMNDFRGPMELVDGKQRLTAVRKFLNNELPIFDGNYIEDFEDELPIGEPDFIFAVNNLPTRKEVLQWYIQLNSGGTVHTQEEIDKVKSLLETENDTNRS